MLSTRILCACAIVVAADYLAAERPSLCRKLHDEDRSAAEVDAYYLGVKRNVSVYWSEPGPSRAAAALLAAVMRHGLRYNGVHLRRCCADRSPPDLCDLQRMLCSQEQKQEKIQFSVAPSVRSRWGGRCEEVWSCRLRSVVTGGASAPWDQRPELVGEGVVPASAALFAYVPSAVGKRAACLQLRTSHRFYANASLLRLCDFFQPSEAYLDGFTNATERNKYCSENETCLTVLTPRGHEDVGERLLSLAEAQHVPLAASRLREEVALPTLFASNRSFLFVDYDYWSDRPGVYYALPPFVGDFGAALGHGASFYVADVRLFAQRAPPLYEAIRRFRPDASDLRRIVELEAQKDSVEEAVCAWALGNLTAFKQFSAIDRSTFETKLILVFLCKEGTSHNNHSEVVEIFNATVLRANYSNYKLSRLYTDCSDRRDLQSLIDKYQKSFMWNSVVGVVAAGEGVAGAARAAAADKFVLVAYDGPMEEAGAYSVGGSVADLWLAHVYFFRLCGWRRVVVLAERSLAGDLSDAFVSEDSLVTRRVYLTGDGATLKLKSLQSVDARIFVINGTVSFVRSVLCAASGLGMTASAGYAWLVRDRPAEVSCENASAEVDYFTISYWRSGAEEADVGAAEEADVGAAEEADVGAAEELRAALGVRWGGGAWPRLAAPLLDALLLLVRLHAALLGRHPRYTFELRGPLPLRDFAESINETKMEGVSQTLRFKRNLVEEPTVYVDEWRAGRRHAVAVWRVANNGSVIPLRTVRQPYVSGAPRDGGAECRTTRSGDPFAPRCHDAAWAALVAACALLPPALYVARRQRLARLARRYRLAMAQQRAYRDDVFAELAAHMVDAAEVELREELGSGHFGRVRLAILRSPPRAAIAIAVKEAHAAADERELLREACLLASLKHESVVRFVGVCCAGTSALVLMEYAFHGDLRRYLRERCLLAETSGTDGEAEQVAAPALTRLVRQAAAALAYLADRRVVHRDVRAANCLVDSRRALKLADFGMARELAGRADEVCDYAYMCRRRALVPVQAMAPENILAGAFSAASDVWALGVLMVEVVTLGARPYGAWPPQRIACHVEAGGRPPLPVGATPQTRAVASLCWQRAPHRRPRASQIVAYLASQPQAMAPVVRYAPAPDSPRHDSGFGEYAHRSDYK